MTKMLCFISKRKKASDIGVKQILRFFSGLSLGAFAIGAKIVVITLLINFVWIGAVEAQPSAVKSDAIKPGHERPETFNGSLQSREAGLEKVIWVARPVYGLGVNGSEFNKDSGTENSTSIGAANLVAITPSKISPNTKEGDAYDKGFKHWLIWFALIVAMVPLIFQMFDSPLKPGMKHNVRGMRRRSRPL